MIDLAKHLRSVNFALVLLSVGLLAVGGLTRPSEYEQAFLDLDGFVQLREDGAGLDHETPRSNWFERYVQRVIDEEAAAGHAIEDERLPDWVHNSGTEERLSLDSPHVLSRGDQIVFSMFEGGQMTPFFLRRHGSPEDGLQDTSPSDYPLNSVDDFRALWDDARHPLQVYLVLGVSRTYLVSRSRSTQQRSADSLGGGPRATMSPPIDELSVEQMQVVNRGLEPRGESSPGHGQERGRPFRYHGIRHPTPDEIDRFRRDGVSVGADASSAYRLMTAHFSRQSRNVPGAREDYVFGFYVRAIQAPVRPVEAIREVAGFGGRFGSFEEVFPDLVSATSGIHAARFDRMMALLNERHQDAGGDLDVVGFSIPTASILPYGIVLIAGVQIYFIIHLTTFSTKVSRATEVWEFAWIGLYPGCLSKLALVLSSVGLPVAAALYLATVDYKAPDSWMAIAMMLGFYVCHALGGVTVCRIWDVWDKQPTRPRAALRPDRYRAASA